MIISVVVVVVMVVIVVVVVVVVVVDGVGVVDVVDVVVVVGMIELPPNLKIKINFHILGFSRLSRINRHSCSSYAFLLITFLQTYLFLLKFH